MVIKLEHPTYEPVQSYHFGRIDYLCVDHIDVLSILRFVCPCKFVWGTALSEGSTDDHGGLFACVVWDHAYKWVSARQMMVPPRS